MTARRRVGDLHAVALVGRLLLVLALTSTIAACASQPRFIWYSELPAEPEQAPRGTIEPGDTILVQVASHPELSGEFVIGTSGSYNHPVAGVVNVQGLEPMRAAGVIKEALSRFVEVTDISVTLTTFRPMQIMVFGEVAKTGAYEVPTGSGLLTALALAGGLSEFASEDSVYVLRTRPAPQRIRFRYSDLTKPEAAAVKFRLREGDAILVE